MVAFVGSHACAEPPPRSASGVAGSPAQRIANRESELTAQLYDGISRAFSDCAKMAAFIRRFHADVKDELARLDRERQPSDYDYLFAKRVAWKKKVLSKSGLYLQAHSACHEDPEYRAAKKLVPSLKRRSYCKEPAPAPPRQRRAAAPPPPELHVVPQVALEAKRLRGDPNIQPDVQDAMAMAVEEMGTVAVVKMCLDERGKVDEATMLKTSCFAGYDAKLLAQIRTWEYSPFLVDGKPYRVCTSLTFIYRPE
jgi:hypothetical protein